MIGIEYYNSMFLKKDFYVAVIMLLRSLEMYSRNLANNLSIDNVFQPANDNVQLLC